MFVSLPVRWKIKPLKNIIFRFSVFMNVLILLVCNDGCCVPIRRPYFTGQDRTGQDRTGQGRTGQDRTGQDLKTRK